MAPASPSRGTVAELIGQNPASARAQLLTSSATPVAWGSAYARFPAAACCLPAGHTTQWHKYFLIWSGYIDYSLGRAAGMYPKGRPRWHLNFQMPCIVSITLHKICPNSYGPFHILLGLFTYFVIRFLLLRANKSKTIPKVW